MAILNDSLLTPGWAAGYLKASGQVEIARTDNMTHEELDQVINFMIERKKAGQFRAIWEDYGQCVNLLASGEVWLADAWNPVVEDVKKQDVVCKYAFPKEGFTAWYHGIAVQKDTPNLEAALDYINFCLEGWWGSQVAAQGYYSPTTTCDVYLQELAQHRPGVHRLRVVVSGRLEPRPEGRLADHRARHRRVRHPLGQPDALDDLAGRPRLLRDALERLPVGVASRESESESEVGVAVRMGRLGRPLPKQHAPLPARRERGWGEGRRRATTVSRVASG